MKKFEQNDTAFTPPANIQKQSESKGFDINQLLQILPKLNIGSLFNTNKRTQASSSMSTQNSYAGNSYVNNIGSAPQNNYDTRALLHRQNSIETLKTIDRHQQTIKQIREDENNKKPV